MAEKRLDQRNNPTKARQAEFEGVGTVNQPFNHESRYCFLLPFSAIAAAGRCQSHVTFSPLMAQVSMHPLPPTPPAPVYSPARSQSPPSSQANDYISSRKPTHGNPLQPSPHLVEDERGGQSRRVPSHVQVFSPNGLSYVDEIQEGEHLSPILSSFPRRDFSGESNMSANSIHRRAVSANDRLTSPNPPKPLDTGEMQSPSHEPLHYHHKSLEEQVLAKRIGKLNVGTNGSNSPSADPPQQQVRNNHLGADLQRPDSGFSSTSSPRGRNLSPHTSPAGQRRSTSRHSHSPDNRPLSYIDLLNVPYPQPAPSGADKLINQGLRSAIGENASLLSTRKTLEMYRMNVKKTNDPAIQYEFAIFMISAAQEEALSEDMGDEVHSNSGSSHKSGAPPIRSDLLKEAKNILKRLADTSYPFAQYYLADGYASGLFSNGKPDLDKSFALFHAASKHGHAEAMYRTALCYEYGWGCRVDAAKAVQFYQHAASKNHPGAMLRLGRACLTGEMGLVKRYREGIRWLTRGSESADFQYNQAPYDLACLHEEGYGPDVFKDESYAAQLYTKAADLGHKDAGFRLGEAYEFGQLNCPKDAALSLHFYTGSAEQGHPQAQMALCAWYMVGIDGVLEKDEAEAYEWARKSAEQGLPKAQYTLGYFTEMGIGCRRDPLEANVWYVRAADQGDERATHRLKAIRAAVSGVDPVTAAQGKMSKTANGNANGGDQKGAAPGKF